MALEYFPNLMWSLLSPECFPEPFISSVLLKHLLPLPLLSIFFPQVIYILQTRF